MVQGFRVLGPTPLENHQNAYKGGMKAGAGMPHEVISLGYSKP